MNIVNFELLKSEIKNTENPNKEKDKQIKKNWKKKNKSMIEHLQNMVLFIKEYVKIKENENNSNNLIINDN